MQTKTKKKKRSRPISYKLNKNPNKAVQVHRATEWANERYKQSIALLNQLNDTASNQDWDGFDNAMRELRQLVHRQNKALPNVFEILAGSNDKV
ncbi:hypothetical protein [Conchiformibius steedae]|uniref:hypothetical protein n=1 Tax=Conchiformibius steedae TaxID=153493 RepID=UPI0026EB2460|nr:hypothetical protein [Conchiformibius steedae]